MATPNDHQDGAQPEFFYEEHKVPTSLKVIYTVFGVWAVIYMVQYMFPDLIDQIQQFISHV